MSFGRRRITVKICGMSHPDDLETADGADLIGIVLDVPGSIRSRTLEEARTLVRMADRRWKVVGVAVRPHAEFLRKAWDEVGVDWVQVHGPLPRGLDERERRRILPSVGLPAADPRPGEPTHAPPLPDDGPGYPFIHLDTATGAIPGGTGRVSDWSIAREFVRSRPEQPFMLGGGLGPANVARALDAVGPAAVDVSSGVEDRPGRKSAPKIRAFLRQVREWEEAHA